MRVHGRGTPVTRRPILAVHSGHMATRGDRYRDAREAADLSQPEVAARARVSVKTVQRLEAGNTIRERHREAIEAVLGLEPEHPPAPPGPVGRSIADFTDFEIVQDLMRRLNEGRRAIENQRRIGNHMAADDHTDVEEDEDGSTGLTSSG